jgi:hypothetical protein
LALAIFDIEQIPVGSWLLIANWQSLFVGLYHSENGFVFDVGAA